MSLLSSETWRYINHLLTYWFTKFNEGLTGQKRHVTYHAPPERVGVRAEIFLIDVSFDDVHKKSGKYQTKKPDVKRRK